MSLKSLRRSRAAFTLIELLVVVLILAILMAIALPMYLNAVADANKRACQTNMKQIATALQAYRTRNPERKYPPSATALTDLTTAQNANSQPELTGIPKCPENTADYTVSTGADQIGPVTITCPGTGATYHGKWDNGTIDETNVQ